MSRGLLAAPSRPPWAPSLPLGLGLLCGVDLAPESSVLEAPSVSLASWVPGPLSSQDVLSEVV